jgi:TolA-binding protein
MDRKELIALLVLVLLVAVAATARLSGMTSALFGPREARNPVRGAPRGRENGGPGSGLGRLIWPEPRERYRPRGIEARTLFDAGERIFSEGLFDAAVATYRRFIELYPDQAACEVGRFRIGQCFTLAERHAEAAGQYELFLRTDRDSDLRPMALLWSGIHHTHLDDLAMARKRLEEVVAQYGDTAFAEGARQRLAALGREPQAPPAPDPPPESM